MKRAGAVLLTAILACGLAPVRGEEKGEKGSGELKALDAKLTDAFQKGDWKTLEKHTADDALFISPTGRTHNKKEHFERLGMAEAKVAELKETDVKARVNGDTGVVTGLLHLKGMVKDKDISGEYRWTRVYTKKDGMWLVILEQHTYVQPKEQPKEE